MPLGGDGKLELVAYKVLAVHRNHENTRLVLGNDGVSCRVHDCRIVGREPVAGLLNFLVDAPYACWPVAVHDQALASRTASR